MDTDVTVYVNTRTGERVTLVTRDGKRVLQGDTPDDIYRGVIALQRMLMTSGSRLPPVVERHAADGEVVVGLVESITTTLLPSAGADVEVDIVLVPWTLPPIAQPIPEAT